MTPFEQTLHRKIKLDGPMRFDAFMQACLSLPEGGYYQGQQAIGGKADFVTAPEISQIFGEMIGIWLLDRWIALNKPKRFTLLEFGPGRGTLMSDALRLVQRLEPAFIESMQLGLYEQNKTLQAEQQTKLDAFEPVWLEDLGESTHLNADTPLLVISNEFFDALPVRLFKFVSGDWSEIAVSSNEDKFEFAAEKLDADLKALMPKNVTHTATEQWFEFSPSARQFMIDLATHIKISGGAMMTIDYGYAERAYKQVTLQAVKDHQMVELFHRPGEVDISAHVDFSLLADTAQKTGLTCWPLMTQKHMLLSLGAEQRLQQLLSIATTEQARALQSGFDRLTADAQMGELFKVLCVSDTSMTSWAGNGD